MGFLDSLFPPSKGTYSPGVVEPDARELHMPRDGREELLSDGETEETDTGKAPPGADVRWEPRRPDAEASGHKVLFVTAAHHAAPPADGAAGAATTASRPSAVGKAQTGPSGPSPVLGIPPDGGGTPQQKGNRPLRDSDALERNPWESFLWMAIFGLSFAIVIPFALQLLWEFNKQKLEVGSDTDDNSDPDDNFELIRDEEENRTGLIMANLGVVMPWKLRVSASSFFPPIGLYVSAGVACVASVFWLFRYSSKVVDQFLKEISDAANCCPKRSTTTPSSSDEALCTTRCCCRNCRKVVFLVAFSLLPLAAWGGRSLWKAVASHEYYICQLVCSKELKDYGNTTLYRRCKENHMVQVPSPTVWTMDSNMAMITSEQLVFKPKNPSKYREMCDELFAIDHSDWGERMLQNQHNFTAFEGLLLQSRQIGVLEIYGPPCGVAWLIMMVASRLALRRKLTALNTARKLFLKQNLVSKSTDYIWLFSHMYFMQGMSIEDIQCTWVVQRLKDTDPAWQSVGVVQLPSWLEVTLQEAGPKESDQEEDEEGQEEEHRRCPREGDKVEEEHRRCPREGDKVEVTYKMFWVRKGEKGEVEVQEPVDHNSSQSLKFTVGRQKDQVIDAFDIGVQLMGFPSGLQGQESRKCEVANFFIHLDEAKQKEDCRAAAGFHPTDIPPDKGWTHLVYEVKLCHVKPKEEEVNDADGDSFVDNRNHKPCSLSPEFKAAAPWSFCFALGFTLIPGLVRAFNAAGSNHKMPLYGILSTPEVAVTLFVNMVVIFFSNGLVFFGFVRAYFALNDKLQTMLAFDCMWQFPEEHLLKTVEDSDGSPLLQDAEEWVQVLDAVEKKLWEEQNEQKDAVRGVSPLDDEKRKVKKREFFDHSGYRARFTPQSIEEPKALKKNLGKLGEWFYMRRYLQIDAYDERISLELAMVVTLITLLPEVAVVIWNFKVLGKEKSRVQAVNVLALWNFVFSFIFLYRYLMVTLKFNDAYDRQIEQLASLRSQVELALAKRQYHLPKSPSQSQGKVKMRAGSKPEGAPEATPVAAGQETVEVPEEVALLSQYLASMRKSGSWALFFGFKVDRRLVSGYLSFAALSVLTQVFPIFRGLSGEADN